MGNLPQCHATVPKFPFESTGDQCPEKLIVVLSNAGEFCSYAWLLEPVTLRLCQI